MKNQQLFLQLRSLLVLAPLAGARAQGAQEGPFEIEKCRSIDRPIDKPGSYKLVKNLTGPFDSEGNCLFITADAVTIDLAGFTITGSGAGIGIVAVGVNSIAVRNGSISGFPTGVNVAASGTNGAIVEGLRVFGQAGGSGSSAGIAATGIVKDNTVLGFEGFGIDASGTLIHNYVFGNQVGILVGFGSTIGNTADNNSTIGIEAFCPSNLTDNTAVGNGTNLVLNSVRGGECNNTNNVAP